MRGNLRESFKRYGAAALFVIFLMFAVFFALTQEPGSGTIPPDVEPDAAAPGLLLGEESPGENSAEAPPEWTPPGPARWFRSNSGGMALEEIPSRLAALRNDYALVIDYISPAELPQALLSFYTESFDIEVRALYERGQESRRQWLFRDAAGEVRVTAVFDQNPGEAEPQAGEGKPAETSGEETAAAPLPEPPGTVAVEELPPEELLLPAGFIEVYNAHFQISKEHQFFGDGAETVTDFFYHRNVLVRAEARRKTPGEEDQHIYTDVYRYNRSASLRSVQRLYHEKAEAGPVRLAFPSRTLDAASDNSFFSEKLPLLSDFFGDTYVEEGWRMVYTTDERGRVLTQSLLDKEDKVIWAVTNTWSGERIVSALRIEGEEERLAEYEYDSEGNRIVERNIRNGVLERLVRTDGKRETEELYMNGVVILKALWEDGRKISEERVRSR
ncbi:MAG: hypothetical protein LBD48_14090 [Treponema sp.]|jgi:hypothetical protein|nr:hypothetical protein [Treponema sp.]